MSLESAIEHYPKDALLKNGAACRVRPLESGDAKAFNEFFLALPGQEIMYLKHRVTDPTVIRGWCKSIDLGRNLPLLALLKDKVIGVATLHQQLGGWKRHIGRVSVHVHPLHRGQGIARLLVSDLIDIGRQCGLQKVEAEFIGQQESAMKMFAQLGFHELVRLDDYVRDMQAITHDYILMDLGLKTDEEYAGMG